MLVQIFSHPRGRGQAQGPFPINTPLSGDQSRHDFVYTMRTCAVLRHWRLDNAKFPPAERSARKDDTLFYRGRAQTFSRAHCEYSTEMINPNRNPNTNTNPNPNPNRPQPTHCSPTTARQRY